MHEWKFTEQIVETIIAELKKYPDKKPKSITVTVGEVYHLVPESVLAHYELLTKDTVLKGVRIDLEEERLEIFCRQCRKSGSVEDHHLIACRHCYSRDVATLKGDKILIKSIELES